MTPLLQRCCVIAGQAGSFSEGLRARVGLDVSCCLVQALPALPLQIVDFNGDRLNDIVLVSHDGLYGWAQV